MIKDLLKSFIEQASTNNLKTSQYPKTYDEFELRISFGQGSQARIPWIAILKEGQQISHGIYPVYLYYKVESKILICFGVSETNLPDYRWSNKITNSYKNVSVSIKDPIRYGSSFVFKEYIVNNLNISQSDEVLEADLSEMLRLYRCEVEKIEINTSPTSQKALEDFKISKFQQDILDSFLKLDNNMITGFTAALCTKPFIILTGLSGSGKTKLAQAFSQWICEEKSQTCMVPVGADWTNRDPLLGYPNAIDRGKYIKPEYGVVDLLIEACKARNSNIPYFLILDEMNLSHVERYFADFLSAMESDEYIHLHSGDTEWDGVPPKLRIPKNLFIIGTVNIDETTYMFSPKVLDRANVIDFSVSGSEMKLFLENPAKPDMPSLNGAGSSMAADFMRIAKTEITDFSEADEINPVLLKFFNELKKSGAEFGYRTASEIYRFTGMLSKLTENDDKKWDLDDIIDAAIMQKLLPKIHGSRSKLEPVLKTLAGLCLTNKTDNAEADNIINKPEQIDYRDRDKIRFPLSLEKIMRMKKRVAQDGFTSFAEA